MKISLLAVGTELTTGQIVNKNGASLAQKLTALGLDLKNHLVVPDDRAEILRALDYCSASDLIFITGGLGPTSDDFTRDLVSQWSGRKLVFDDESWSHVCERLTSRGYTVKEFQRQQCYFPEGSQILKNSQGTANGFTLRIENLKNKPFVFVLPGPPREIAALWESSIGPWLDKNTEDVDRKIIRSWDTLGLGESDVAAMVETIFQGKTLAGSDLWNSLGKGSEGLPFHLPIDIGYRVHLPYVEVKLTYPISANYTCELFVQKVEEILAPITVLRDFQDVTVLFAEKIKAVEFAIYDFVSNGFLHHRLSPALRNQSKWMYRQSLQSIDPDFFNEESNFLAILPLASDRALIIADLQGSRLQKEIEAPTKTANMLERRLQYFAEMALIEFAKKF